MDRECSVAATDRSVYDIAVIGDGAAAALVLLAAAESAPRCKLISIGPAAAPGAGLAYSTTDPAHLLNVVAARMSAYADRPDDFLDFLRAQHCPHQATDFVPRARYGAYLKARVAAARSERDWPHRRTTVEAVQRVGDTWQLRGADGDDVRARHIVLALGAPPQQVPAGVDPAAIASQRYVPEPWSWLNANADRPAPQRTLVIGGGLTAVDLVLSLAARRDDACIHVLARHPAWPGVHSAGLTTAADPWCGAIDIPPLSRALAELRRLSAKGADWRALIDAQRPYTAARWARMSHGKRQGFIRHALWLWQRARHRMAPQVAQRLASLQAAGRLSITAARQIQVRAEDSGCRVLWQSKDSADVQSLKVDLVLQATGVATLHDQHLPPLLGSLLSQGLARIDALRWGLEVDDQQRLINAKGEVQPSVHVLGWLARGSRFECTAIPEIREAARRIAERLAGD